MIGRLPLRLRLALAFTAAMAVLLGVASLVLVLSLASALDRSDERALAARADDVAALIATVDPPLDASEPRNLSADDAGFTQVLDSSGAVVAAGPRLKGFSVLTSSQLAAALSGEQMLTIDSIPGVEDSVRVLARPVDVGSDRVVIVAGTSLEERDEAVGGLIRLLVVGGPIALVLAAGMGYLLAASALRPVEAMRGRAAAISGTEPGVRLPLPEARDELRRLGETLNAMLDRVDDAIGRERKFVADASHELRTPLAILKGEIELALNGKRSADELRKALVSASEETDRLERLAEDLLVISRADRGHLPVRVEELGAEELLARVAGRFQDRARRESREVKVQSPDELAVQADPLRVEQALGNLVDNALRHGMGTVTLTARAEDGAVALAVGDEGPGPPDELVDKIFERFARGAESRRSGGGAGLGLSIVRAIARAHGGDARIDGRDGRFEVVVELPVPQHDAPQRSAAD